MERGAVFRSNLDGTEAKLHVRVTSVIDALMLVP
jgi:hypothetical protein